MIRRFKKTENRNPGVLKAIEIAGCTHKLAKVLNLNQATIIYWLYVQCPAKRAIQLERVYNIPRNETRPDLF